jgi:hypothetical protein
MKKELMKSLTQIESDGAAFRTDPEDIAAAREATLSTYEALTGDSSVRERLNAEKPQGGAAAGGGFDPNSDFLGYGLK